MAHRIRDVVRGGVALVVLDRADKRNAIDADLLLALREALARHDADPEVGAIVLTGEGDVFCAGMDLTGLGSLIEDGDIGGTTPGPEANSPWPALSTPLIGAINGPAITGGLELALHCDVLIGCPEARFADTHGRVGLVPGWGLSVLLPLAVGRGTARRMSLTGDFLPAERALELGLLTEIVPRAELVDAAVALAGRIADNDRAAVSRYVELYRGVELEDVGSGYAVETSVMDAHLAATGIAAEVADRLDAVARRGRGQREDAT